SDNDQYAHVNNVIYLHLFDAIVNTYLIEHCGIEPTKSEHIGLVVSSFCEFFSPVSFPDVLDLGLRVTHLGSSSVTYEVGVFKAKTLEQDEAAAANLDMPVAVGGYTHVFVDRTSRRSTPLNEKLKSNFKKLMTKPVGAAVSKL
ncbi:hypothetical protein ID866_8935, partial [Astraeus odoratus]